jgi:formate hydrogenlyase subunit 6/NADH:ubiquinone oxidoreductase subunit I
MTHPNLELGQQVVLDVAGFDAICAALRAQGYTLWGPRVREGAIVLDELSGSADLPRGVGDEQAPGHYRLRTRGDQALFGYATSAQSPKRELLVPRTELYTIRKRGQALDLRATEPPQRKLALIGARACELAAIAIQDRVLTGGPYADTDYRARRDQLFVLAIHCSDPAGTCFCVSMQTGPKATSGFDLAATELLEPEHAFVVEVGSTRGAELLASVALRPAQTSDIERADQVTERAAQRMGRALDTRELPESLLANLEHPRWDDVATRCLGCANCTLVCPTCFCTSVEDVTDLSGEVATRSRIWDSCFTADFAYVSGGSARPTLRARYRQWLIHKLATWHEQFGSSGCVGCGRCVTWCPVGIDITAEAAAIRSQPKPATKPGS